VKLARLPKPALAILAGLVVVFASACSSSGVTLPPAGPAAPAGASAAAGATAAPAGASAAVNPSDPSSIITQVLSSGQSTTSFHIKIEVSGTIKAAALQSAAGSSGAALTSDLKLDGTAVEGDVDVANQAAHLSLTVAPIAMLGNVPLTGDLILKDSVLYYKVSLLGPKYTKTALGDLTGGLPVTVPTAGPSAMAGVADELANIRQQLDAAGVKATLVGVEQIGGKDAYHITFAVPLDKLNAEIATAAASAAPGMKIDSASIDLWTYKDSYQIAKVEIKGASSSLGSLGIAITVTDYGAPVTITAPAATDIQAATP
jgi:hypothetical protein